MSDIGKGISDVCFRELSGGIVGGDARTRFEYLVPVPVRADALVERDLALRFAGDKQDLRRQLGCCAKEAVLRLRMISSRRRVPR